MNDLLEQLTNKKQRLDSLLPLPKELVENLEEWLKVELTYSSNAIEGNTLTRIETAEVIDKGVNAVVSGKPLKDQLEARNHANAVDYIRRLIADRKSHQFITESDIQTIHHIILTGIDDKWAGKYRQTQVMIRGADTEFPLPHKVPYHMQEFVQWLEVQQEVHPVRVAAEAHFRLVSIHPFIDGNGRTARLLMNLILLINGYPVAIIRNEDRTAYIDSVYRGQKHKDFHSFYQIVEEAVDRSLEVYIQAAEGKTPPLSSIMPSEKQNDKELLRIGELAKETKETVFTLRFWTKQGLLKVTDYTEGGYQLYPSSMIEQVRTIRRMQETERLTLSEIKQRLQSDTLTTQQK